jgi:SAM-dependent methyltransferase
MPPARQPSASQPSASQPSASQPSASQPGDSYADPRLAALYDALNPADASTVFYLSLPAAPPARILDVGCGTGLLACEFAARGYDVTGADPAAAMLATARARAGGDRVRWVQASAAGLDTGIALDTGTGLDTAAGPDAPATFDLIIMTGHVFQLFLEDRDVRAALRTLVRHLAPGGRLAFETRNPAVREWQDWNPRDTRQRVEAAGVTADVHYDISAVAGELVTYETWYQFAGAGDLVVVPDTLRFMDQVQVAAFLAEAGLTRVTWYGDWDGSAYGPTSPEIVAVASGPAGTQ